MEIPLGVDVLCENKSCGLSMAVVVNPITDQVTHIVVKEAHSPHTERILPACAIRRSGPNDLVLTVTKEDLAAAEPFVESYYIRTTVDRYAGGITFGMPYVTRTTEPRYVAEKTEAIPPGEVAIHRTARVVATDGPIGKVDEFIVQNDDCHVTHLMMREGHLWGRRDVAIPVSRIDRMNDETVYLTLSKKEVGELPAVPVKRK